MDVVFDDDRLDRLEVDPSYTMNLGNAIVKAYRRRMQYIRAAADERDFYALKSLHFEWLRGERQGQYSMRLNDQFRLIVELEEGDAPTKQVRIVAIEDYH
jgi:proteic killer suppression protein